MLRFTGACCAAALIAFSAPALAQGKPEAKNMNLLGYNDLQARSAYQPIVQHQGNRWIAYIGHHGGTDQIPKPVNPMTGKAEFNGTSIVDVTDPKHPKYLAHIPGEEGNYESGGGQMVRACDGKDLPKGDRDAVYLLRTNGKLAHEIYDVRDPAHPKLLSRIDGLQDTHKNFWECDTGIAYLVSGPPGWRVKRMTQVYDLSDPAHPVKIRDFGLPGQQPGSTGPTPVQLHGMISVPKANRIYFGYGTNSDGIMQIVDRDKLLNGPKEPTEENLKYPEVGRWEMSPFNGAHTAFPILNMPIPEYAKDKVGKSRNIAVVTDEQIANECGEARQMAWFVDMTVEKHPVSIANFQVPEKPGDFCDRGGRFGTHSSNENMTPIYYGKVMFFAYFNAGVRAVDIRDPYHPKEIGHYIPAVTGNTDKRCVKLESGQDSCKIAIQTNNVEVDDRGYIYIVDRANTGLHILELTGDARKAANFAATGSAVAAR
jgi:hypothetical protein